MGEAWETTNKDFTIDKRIRQLQYSVLMMQSCGDKLTLAQRKVIDIEIRTQIEMIADIETRGGQRDELRAEPAKPHSGGRGAWNGKRGL